MRAAIAAAIRRVSDWDSRQERTAHPWWTPRGILFWWMWRPAVFGAAFGAAGLVFWILAEAARSVLGTDREVAAGIGGVAVTIWFLWMLRRRGP